jgi:Xaa-Pro aminopeptidase
MTANEKLIKLRQIMKDEDIQALVIPSADPHQSEYVAPHWGCREWLSGFTGSAGLLVITETKSALWADSRYYLQAEKQLSDSEIILMKAGLPETPDYKYWLAETLEKKGAVGYDPMVRSVESFREMDRFFQAFPKLTLKAIPDPFAKIWENRPPIPAEPVRLMPEAYSGRSVIDKLQQIRSEMYKQELDYHLVCSLDDIAWTLNIRGNDVLHVPVAISWLLIGKTEAIFYINQDKIDEGDQRYLENSGIAIRPYEAIEKEIGKICHGKKILIDPARTNMAFYQLLNGAATIKYGKTLSTLLKAVKNETELQGFRDAHIRDGAAMVKWMVWLHQEAGKKPHTEITIADKLAEYRKAQDLFMDLSFETIPAMGPNGALPHYSATPDNAAEIPKDGILLVDSGGQYLDGSTDITRTLALGKVENDKAKFHYTLVLKGMIQLSIVKFPAGTAGNQLDAIARRPLWNRGINFGHGTGHGVGHHLAIHEGPQSISPKSTVPLKTGMVLSNEPGIYIPGEYGIRTENLMAVIPYEKNQFGDFLTFETLTVCPIDTNLLIADMLSSEERKWLNDYHTDVLEKLSPLLNEAEQNWLKKACQPI